MLSIRGLNYEVETEHGTLGILKNIDLDIETGRFVVITGPNGGGKTSLAKAIMGLVPATAESMTYNGTDIAGLAVVAAVIAFQYLMSKKKPAAV